MTNRDQRQLRRASFGAQPLPGLLAAGLRLRLSEELSAGGEAAHAALLFPTAGGLLLPSYVSN
jgi:hypothetical protein